MGNLSLNVHLSQDLLQPVINFDVELVDPADFLQDFLLVCPLKAVLYCLLFIVLLTVASVLALPFPLLLILFGSKLKTLVISLLGLLVISRVYILFPLYLKVQSVILDVDVLVFALLGWGGIRVCRELGEVCIPDA